MHDPSSIGMHGISIVALKQQSVTAYGEPESLKTGMLLDTDILGEKRRLIEWIFEPFLFAQGQGEQ